MSSFSAVDGSPSPDALVQYLEAAAEGTAGLKAYAVAAHARSRPDGPILDVGCGAGHDLALLAAAGLTAVGVDPSAVMVTASADRGGVVARADGAALPFRRECFAGCRLERVLIHVEDPDAVVREVLRCVRPGGLVTVCEPDFSRLVVNGEASGWLAGARHPGLGGQLWRLLEAHGCDVLDRVEELAVWRAFSSLSWVGGEEGVKRAVTAGRISAEDAGAWVERQRARDREGTFLGLKPMIQIVARKR